MTHCNEHLQAKKCGQKVYCGTHCDTLQLPQGDFFSFVGEDARVGGRMQGHKEMSGIVV